MLFRSSSAWDQQRFEQDPDNLYFARAEPRRLEAEVLRDCMLAASGRLDLQRPRGSMISGFPSAILGPNGPVGTVMAPQQMQSAGMRAAATPGLEGAPGNAAPAAGPLARRMQQLGRFGGRFRQGQGEGNLFDASVNYRSVYLPVARGLLPRSLEVFDFAEPSMVIGQRETSNTPAQALYLLNNSFVIEQSEVLSSRLLQDVKTSEDRIKLAFQLVCSRSPTADELQASLQYLQSDQSGQTDDSAAVLARFCQALFATAEFRFVN